MSLRSPEEPSTLISNQRLSSCLWPAQQPSIRTHEKAPSSLRTGRRTLSALLRISGLDICLENSRRAPHGLHNYADLIYVIRALGGSKMLPTLRLQNRFP